MPHSQAMRVGHVVDPGEGLEGQLQAELELPAIISILDLAEITRSEVGADPAGIGVPLKLGVIEGVECLRAELQPEPLGKGKTLPEGKIEVVMTRTADGIEAQITVAICARTTRCAGRRREVTAEPSANSLWIGNGSTQVGPGA